MAKDPDVKKVMQSQRDFKKEYAKWRELRGRVVPWPYEMILKGKLTQ
jgi:TRAP-type mannitol/chloroaromatic compound transport system substrate-binding protein